MVVVISWESLHLNKNVKFTKMEINELKKTIRDLIKQRTKTKDLELKALLFQEIQGGIELIRETEPDFEPV